MAIVQSSNTHFAEREASFSSRATGNWRFERDGIVFASNGRVGVLKQVVVDKEYGEVNALVVELDRTGDRILVPAAGVERTRGSAVLLSTTRGQFDDWAQSAPRYDESALTKANVKSLMKASTESIRNARLSIAKAGRNMIETGRL
jgi:hypothetical protein